MTSGPSRQVTVLLTAGEASGDQLGADLMAALRQAAPSIEFRFVGVGGTRMQAAGLNPIFDLSDLSVLGLWEGVKAYPRIVQRADAIGTLAKRERPDVAVLIDSWGFSLRVAHRLRRASPKTRILKYVGPQVWASRPGRAKVLAGAVDRLLSTQSMDAPFYQGVGLPVTFVGNPALARDLSGVDRVRARARLGIPPDNPILLVLPGSRRSEVARLAAPFGEAVAALKASRPDLVVIVPVAATVDTFLTEAVGKWASPPVLVRNDEALKYDLMAAATVALAASGTVTTELGLCGAPMVVAYKVGRLTYLVGKRLITTPWITLINIAAGSEVVPEILQDACTGEALAQRLARLLDDPIGRAQQVDAQNAALDLMGRGTGDPSSRAAACVLDELTAK